MPGTGAGDETVTHAKVVPCGICSSGRQKINRNNVVSQAAESEKGKTLRQAPGLGSLGEKGGVNKVIRKGFMVRVTFAERLEVCEEQSTQLSGEGIIPGHGRAHARHSHITLKTRGGG